MSRMAIAISLAALAAITAFAAVALSGGSDSPTGDSMEAKVIELESNPTTGYSWAIYYSDGLHVESEFVPPSTGLVGAPGKQVFTITADSPGTYHFKAEYKRSWETVDPIQVYEEDLEFRFGHRHSGFPAVFRADVSAKLLDPGVSNNPRANIWHTRLSAICKLPCCQIFHMTTNLFTHF